MEQNRNFLWGFKAHQSTIKVFLVLFLGVVLSMFLIGNVSATVTTDGTITYQDIGGVNYTTVTFTSNGTFNSTIDLNMSILIVAGGGAGGNGNGGGGGAGGLIYYDSYEVLGNINVVIGQGGIGNATGRGFNGTNSSFGIIQSKGGGGGAGYSTYPAGSGGSGGGGSAAGGSLGYGIIGQGNNGGSGGAFNSHYHAGGGGGAGAIGQNGNSALCDSGHGGIGLNYSINGTNIYYAGGGGGGGYECGAPVSGLGIIGQGGNGAYNNGGSGGAGNNGVVIVRYLTSDAPDISVILNSPTNNSILTIVSNLFNVSLSMVGTNYSYQWKNNTYNIWFNNGTLFNTTFVNGLTGNSTNISKNIGGFIAGNYLWNSYACYGNTTFSNCSWGDNGNYTLTMGSSINSITYNNNTYETSLEQFIINFSLAEGAELSLAKLNYNGTNYTISNITSVGNNYILERTINIPLNVNPLANQTNTFYVIFTYEGTFIQQSSSYTQNSSFINLVKCGSPYTIQALNFTFYNEYIQSNINATKNKTTLYSSFKYWLGDGTVYKNYSFQNITSTLNNYQFCIYPYLPNNYTFKTNMDMEFYAEDFRENKYYLRNSTLTNISNDILLYLLPEEYATKFFLTFKQGTSAISDATVTVQKYFTGLGMYKTVAILLTDADGKATMWQEVDKTFKYSIVKNGVLLGTIERVSICSATPCSLTIMTTTAIDSAFEAYDEYYAVNVLSNLSYNKNTNMVTYSFIDVTGLANYFRLEVKQVKLNSAGVTICDTTSYSSAGTLSCNLTGYDGDFFATGYVSRSPEMVDKILSFVIDEDVLGDLGITGVFIVMILLITLVIAAAVISRGNPTTVLFVLGMSILGTKLIGLFPFTWIVVVTLEVLIIFMIFKIKT